MSKPMTRCFLPSCVALAGALSLAGCDYIFDVVIPPVDLHAPACIPSLYQNHQHHWAAGETYTSSDPNKVWVAVAGAFDSGGTRRLVVHRTAWASYDQGGGVGVIQTHTLKPRILTASGQIGQTVKNGLYSVEFVRPSTYGTSGPGKLLASGFKFSIQAEDFHGNQSSRQGATFIYQP